MKIYAAKYRFRDVFDEAIDILRALYSPRLATLLIIDFKTSLIPTIFVRGQKIRYANPAFSDLVGRTEKDLQNTELSDYVIAEDVPKLVMIHEKPIVLSVESRWLRPDGSIVFLTWSSMRVNGWSLARIVKHEVYT